jgi:uncharacterized membrane protein
VGERPPEVFVAVFETTSRASHVHGELAVLEGRGLIALLAAAVISRDLVGQVQWSVSGPAIGHICSRADTIATILDVLLPAPVLVAGLTAASYDGADGEDAEREFSECFIREIAGGVEPGGSVFIGVIEDRWVPEVERGLRGYHRLTRKRS